MSSSSPANKIAFLDEVDIYVFGGAGGNGCMAFRREKYVPMGGPSGGDGGNGGRVYIEADSQFNTLQHLAGRHHWRAQRGGHGMGKDCHGKNGEGITIRVPPGTIICDDERSLVLKDLDHPGDRVCVARGGKGGRGNAAFKSATRQAPRITEPGTPGEERVLHLELRLIADVGLVGKPNAGKSTLLSRLSAARPKIAAYPFTTLTPHLGIVELARWRRFVMADIPGLIEGAHEGAGLGDAFLRHIERTRLLVHMVDLHPFEGEAIDDYLAIRRELEQHSPALANKRELLVANKMDLTDSDQKLAAFRQAVPDKQVFAISAVTGKGLEGLGEILWQAIQDEPTEDLSENTDDDASA